MYTQEEDEAGWSGKERDGETERVRSEEETMN
jgi:hypothetical protein